MVFELDGKSGAVLHKLSLAGAHDTGGAVWGSLSANAKGTRVFVATGDGDNSFSQPLTYAVVALNPKTLKAVDSWQAPPNVSAGDNDFGTTPTVFRSGSKTLVGAGIKTGLYYVLDAAHLKKGPVWSRMLGNSDAKSKGNSFDDICSSAYATGSAYPGGQTLFIAAPDSKGGTAGTGGLFALNPKNGHTIWSVSLDGEPQEGAVTVYDDVVIVPIQKDFFNGQEGGEVDVRSVTDGRLIGSFVSAGTPFSAPVVVDGTIYFGTDDGIFHAVSLTG
jgi:outer membrane protein assembly factor BamB